MQRRPRPTDPPSKRSLRSLNTKIFNVARTLEGFEEIDEASLTKVTGGDDQSCLRFSMCRTDTCTCLIGAD